MQVKRVVKISMQRFSKNVPKRGLNLFVCATVIVCSLFKATDVAAQPTNPPANDNFIAAQEIFGVWGSVTNNTTLATFEAGEPSHAGFVASKSIWYKWTAPQSGEVQLDTLSSAVDTVLAVYTGSALGNLRQVAANDDLVPLYTSVIVPGGASALKFNATLGKTYYFAVDTKFAPGPVILGWAYHSAGIFRFATEDSVRSFVNTTNGLQIISTPVIKCSENESLSTENSTTLSTYYDFGVPGVLVTVTRVAGSTGRMLVNYTTAAITNPIPGDIRAVAGVDYTPVSGTLVFDDQEMTKRIVIQVFPSFDPLTFSPVSSNRNFVVLLTNATPDVTESSDVSQPRLDGAASRVIVQILDADIDPVPARNFQADTNVPPVLTFQPTNAIFNFARAAFRTVEDVTNYWNEVDIWIDRTGTNRDSVTLHYRIDNFLGGGDNASPGELDNNFFPLQPGSDYATPSPADDNNGNSPSGIHGTNPDFYLQGVPNNDYNFPGGGTITFPGGNLFNESRRLTFRVVDDNLTEFNEDFHIYLYAVRNDINGDLVGNIGEAAVTILFDDNDPPAGSVDQRHNVDFGASMAPPITTTPPNMAHPGADSVVYALAVQADSKTVIVGDFINFNATSRGRIARMNVNGSLDTSFNPGSGANDFIGALAQTASGQFIIGGGFTSYNGTQRTRVARVNANGSLDATFSAGQGADANVWALAVQPDGKVILGGEFTSVGGQVRSHIARLNANGTLDTTFNPGTNAPNGTVWAVTLQGDGKILIGGEFTAVGGSLVGGIARLNADGTVDSTFNPGAGTDGVVYAIGLQADGKILIGGQFTLFDFNPRNSLVRLNSDGSVDPTFDTASTGSDGVVYSIVSTTQGIYVGGAFDSYNGTHRRSMVRLQPNGTVDTGFMDTAYNQFAGLHRARFNDAKGTIYSIGVQADGNVMICGSFDKVGGGQADSQVRPDVADSNVWTERKARDGMRNRNNVARLLGGSTPGPGNISFTAATHTAQENQSSLSISLTRDNGTLGYLSANFQVEEGLAQSGLNNDYVYNSTPPIYLSSWQLPFNSSEPGALTRMHSDGLLGDNFTPTDIYGRNWFSYTPGYLVVTINNDLLSQGDRNTTFRLSNPSGADQFFLGGENIPLGGALGFSQSPFTIFDDDHQNGVLGFAAVNFVVNENVTNAVVTVIRTNGSYGTVQVQYATVSGGTATAGSDYQTRSGTLTFPNGTTNKTFTIPITDDSTVEPDETIVLRLSGPTGGAVLGLAWSTNTIVDNDTPGGKLNFSSAAFSTNESAGAALVTVTRSGSSSGTLTVYCAATNGTAIAPGDFTAVTNQLTWVNGDVTPKTLVVPLLDDSVVETNETVSLRIFAATLNGVTNAASIGPVSTATLSIVNDDLRGLVQFSTTNYLASENGGPATITVVRTGGSAESVTVNYTTLDNTASTTNTPPDYSTASGVLSFGPGEVSKSFVVNINDNQIENTNASKLIKLLLSNASPSGTLNSNAAAANITIVDDEHFNEPPGGVDTVFTPVGMNNFVLGLALQTDGKIIAVGDFTTANNVPAVRIVRMESFSGIVDSTLNASANAAVQAVTLQTDGRIVVGGSFTAVNGVTRNRIARINSNGALDTSFNPGSGTDNPVLAVAETFLATGARKLLIGGGFTSYAGTARNGIARVNSDGVLDVTFDTGTGPNGTVYAVTTYPTNSTQAGKVLIGGDFSSVNGTPRAGIARLNSDGSVDLTFNPGSGSVGAVRALVLQADERIVIGGSFTNFNGSALNRLARLNNNGSLDGTFNTGVGADDTVLSIVVQPDARIVVGGLFTHCNGVSRSRITRLNSDGSADPTINFGSGANNFVAASLTQPDGKILIGGGFTEYDGAPRKSIARIYGGSVAGSGTLEFTTANYQVSENATNATLVVRRRGGTSGFTPGGSILIDAITSNVTATNGIHYTGGTIPLTFASGEVFQTLVIPVTDDFEVNADRVLRVDLANISPLGSATIGSQPFAWLTIINDDSAISLGQPTFTVNENIPGGQATITVVRTGATTGTSTVNFTTTTNGTATAGADYTPTTNLVTFEAGEIIKNVTIPIINDSLIEGNETIGIEITNVTGAFLLAPTVGVITISDDDLGPGQIAFASSVYSAGEGSTNAVVSLIRTNGSQGIVSVKLQTTDVTASSSSDYTAQNNITVTFGFGETNKNVLIPIVDDSFVEGDEVFNVTISNPTGGASIVGTNTAQVVIVDNESGLSFTSPTYLVTEEGTAATISVFRIGNTNGVVTVKYTTANIPVLVTNIDNSVTTNVVATAGLDYTLTTNTLSFATGEVLKTFSVSITEDTLVEGDESFGVALSNPSAGVQLLTSNAVVTILDNDTGFTLSSAAYSVDEGATNLIVTVYRTNANTGVASVSISTFTNGTTATVGSDYTATGGSLIFTNGEASKTVLIPINNDLLAEASETFGIQLSGPSPGAQIVGVTSAIATIIDNDASIRFSSTTYAFTEGAPGGAAIITVLRENILTNTVAVNYATADLTAIAGSNLDYTATSGQLVFTNGETSKTFAVIVRDDTLEEGQETVSLSLSSPTGQVQVIGSEATLTIVDNDGGSILAAGSILTYESGPTNNAIDPGETVTLLFALRNASGINMTNLVATLLATNGITTPLPNTAQSYGGLLNNGASVSRPYTFTASGTNGGTVTATFNVAEQSGQGFGTVRFSYLLGTATTVFSNTAAITINDFAIASPYPSSISVTGMVGTVSKVVATVTNLYHPSPDDIDMLLVGPTGANTMLMSDCGGGNFITNVTLTFDDSAVTSLPDSTLISSGTNKPTNFLIADTLPSPAPTGPWGSTLAAFNNTNPNGVWALYIKDDLSLFSGSIQRGWQLEITTRGTLSAATDLSVKATATPNPVVAGSNLTYTITVTNHGPWTATGIVLSNVIPTGATFVSATSGTYSTNTGDVIWNIGSLAKDASATTTLVVTPGVAGSAVLTSTVTGAESDPNLLNNVVTNTTTVQTPFADISVSVVDLPDPVLVAANSTLTYVITISNAGPATATAVSVTNTLPPGVAFLSATPSGYTISGSVVTFANLGSLGSGVSTNATIIVSPLVGGQLTNTTVVASAVTDPLKGNNSVSVKTIVSGMSFVRSGNTLLISWPSDATGYTLQYATNLASPIFWQAESPAPSVVSGMNYVTNTIGAGNRFFRLTK